MLHPVMHSNDPCTHVQLVSQPSGSWQLMLSVQGALFTHVCVGGGGTHVTPGHSHTPSSQVHVVVSPGPQ